MYRKVLVPVLLAVLVIAGFALAQGPNRDVGENLPAPRETPSDGEVRSVVNADDLFGLSIDVNVVNVDVVVTKDRNPIAGLTREHFKVFVDDQEQQITNFRPSEAPITVVLVIQFDQFFSYWADDILVPSAGFVQTLREDDWAAIVSFDIQPRIITDFTQNRNELFFGLNALRLPAYREIALYDAVNFTLDRMENVDGKKVMFLLASGWDTISRATYGEALDRAAASDTVIYSVGLGQLYRTIVEDRLGAIDRITYLQAENALRQLSEATGGMSFLPRFRGEYPSIYQTIATHLRYQYSLGFVPTGLEPDDDLKEIKIEVVDLDVDGDGEPDELDARHKRGFYLRESDDL